MVIEQPSSDVLDAFIMLRSYPFVKLSYSYATDIDEVKVKSIDI
jgi:hypothetical protein